MIRLAQIFPEALVNHMSGAKEWSFIASRKMARIRTITLSFRPCRGRAGSSLSLTSLLPAVQGRNPLHHSGEVSSISG